jgi:hypothetical protein
MNNSPVIGVNFETKTRSMERRKCLIKTFTGKLREAFLF